LRCLSGFWLVALPLATGQGYRANLGLGRAAAIRFPCSLTEIGRGLPPWTQQASRIEAEHMDLEGGDGAAAAAAAHGKVSV
jgi:hypothetical protein